MTAQSTIADTAAIATQTMKITPSRRQPWNFTSSSLGEWGCSGGSGSVISFLVIQEVFNLVVIVLCIVMSVDPLA